MFDFLHFECQLFRGFVLLWLNYCQFLCESLDYFVTLFYWAEDSGLLSVVIKSEVMDKAQIIDGLMMELTQRFFSAFISCLNRILSCFIGLPGVYILGIPA